MHLELGLEWKTAFQSTTHPPESKRRVRIDGRLKRVGDTVFIPSLEVNGTIVHINPVQSRITHISVIAHDFVGREKIILIEQLREGYGISDLHRAWLNELGIYFYDRFLLPNH